MPTVMTRSALAVNLVSPFSLPCALYFRKMKNTAPAMHSAAHR